MSHPTVSVPQFKDMIRHVVIRNNMPLMGWGDFGIGKSQGGAQAAQEEKAFYADVRLGQYDSVDIRGIPSDDGKGRTQWLRASTFPFVGNDEFPDDQIILLALDEINAANDAVSGVAYQLVQERRVGEHVLKPNVRILAMGNPETNRGVTNKQPMPLSNRFVHVTVQPSVNHVTRHFQSIGIAPIYIAFLQWRKNLLHTFDAKDPQKAVATPRTHEMAARLYMDDEMPDVIKLKAMGGAVGEGVAAEFWSFNKVWEKIQLLMPSILTDPSGAQVPKELDMRYAVSISVSGEMNSSNASQYDVYLRRLDPEFTVLAWQLAVLRDPKLHAVPAFIAFAERYRAMFS